MLVTVCLRLGVRAMANRGEEKYSAMSLMAELHPDARLAAPGTP